MPNLRVCYDNAADTATLSASSTAGTLVVANLQNDSKAVPWRSTGTTATLTATWADLQTIGIVALPWTNLTAAATIRVRGYTNIGDTVGVATPVFDSGAVIACRAVTTYLRGVPSGVNSFAFGGASCAIAYVPPGPVRKLVIDLVDGGNAAGYIEASRLVCGAYWEPAVNAEVGVTLSLVDTSMQTRTEAGELKTDPAPRYKKLSFDLRMLKTADRNMLWRIARGNGITVPMFVSLLPSAADATDEDLYQIYGKLVASAAMVYERVNSAAVTFDLEEA